MTFLPVTRGQAPDWPGRSNTGSVILPLPDTLDISLGTIRLPEAELTPKRELHITLLSKGASAVSRSVPESEWEAMIQQRSRHLGLTRRAFLLGKSPYLIQVKH